MITIKLTKNILISRNIHILEEIILSWWQFTREYYRYFDMDEGVLGKYKQNK